MSGVRCPKGRVLYQSESSVAAKKVLEIFKSSSSSFTKELQCTVDPPLIILNDGESSESSSLESLLSLDSKSHSQSSPYGSSSDSFAQEFVNECEIVKGAEQSVKLLRLMFEIDEEEDKSHRAEIDKLEKILSEEMSPLNSKEKSEKRLWMLENLVEHLSKILENGPALADNLRKKIVSDVVPIKYDCHRSIVEFCDLAVDMIMNFQTHLETISWYGDKSSDKHINMEPYIDRLGRAAIGMQLNLNALQQYRSALKKRCENTGEETFDEQLIAI